MSFGPLDDLKVIEHSTLKVPYETLNKQYRNVQKAIDRDCSSLSQSILSVEKFFKSVNADPTALINKTDIINSFNGVIEKLKAIKQHSQELRNDEKDLMTLIKKRLDHLKDYNSSNLIVNKNFKRLRVDRMLIDHFLRVGYYETAKMLAQKSEIEVILIIKVTYLLL
jgi:macrophage erythroblast attacher